LVTVEAQAAAGETWAGRDSFRTGHIDAVPHVVSTMRNQAETRGRMIAYWTTTALVTLALLSGGLAQLARRPENVDGVARLGYPAYVVVILGFWKVLGVIALLVPRHPRLKEWAYAGIFFELTGAAASQALGGGNVGHVLAPLALAALAMVSWGLRPASRAWRAPVSG
jgi:hypothetical protein